MNIDILALFVGWLVVFSLTLTAFVYAIIKLDDTITRWLRDQK